MSVEAMPVVRTPISREDLDHVLEHTRAIWNEIAGARILITGGTGFVGKWLLETLIDANQRLGVGLSASVLTRDPQRFERFSPHLVKNPAITIIRGDACSVEFPSGEFPLVIHAATETQSGWPLAAFDRDVKATRRILEFVRTHETRRLLFTSSGAVYGKQPPELTHVPEDYPGAPMTGDPDTAYGQAKRVSEFLCATYARQHIFAALIARLFAFTGPYLPLDRNFAAGNFVRDALAGGPIRTNGDGTPYRSYLYAADLAIWLWTILVRGESGRPYNVGSGEAVTIAELARTVAAAAGPGIRVEVAQRPQSGVAPSRYVPSVERARNELGLTPRITFEDGIRRTLSGLQDASTRGGTV